MRVSAQTLHLCMEKGIPVIHMSTGAWFHGISHGTGVENAYNRAAQYAAAADPAFCTKFIIPLIHAKVVNQRALILRNGSGPAKDTATRELAAHLRTLDPFAATIDARTFQRSTSHHEIDFLRGWEGHAAAQYFAAFSSIITNRNGCGMQPAAKKAILRAWEQRLDQLTTHPEFGYRCSYRTILRIQARLLVRLLRGDIPHLPWPVVR